MGGGKSADISCLSAAAAALSPRQGDSGPCSCHGQPHALSWPSRSSLRTTNPAARSASTCACAALQSTLSPVVTRGSASRNCSPVWWPALCGKEPPSLALAPSTRSGGLVELSSRPASCRPSATHEVAYAAVRSATGESSKPTPRDGSAVHLGASALRSHFSACHEGRIGSEAHRAEARTHVRRAVV